MILIYIFLKVVINMKMALIIYINLKVVSGPSFHL